MLKTLKTMLLLVLALMAVQLFGAANKPKYIFLFIGDGMGENIRTYYQQNYPDSCLEKFPVIVKTGTNNCFDKVTDSAASGTAIACGVKTYNGAVGLNADKQPVTSLAKIFRDRGYRVGIITSVGLNDATPGAHYANQINRKDYAGVLSDLCASNFDFFAGGWLFYPPDYQEKHYSHLLKQCKYEFRSQLKFDDKAPYNRVVYVQSMSPSWPDEPHKHHYLAETTAFAAEKLSRKDRGFFIMVEGGAIDHLAHGNDLAGTMREMREFDLAVKVALDFMKKHPDDTLIVVTSDHDTGGLNLLKANQPPLWKKQLIRAGAIESSFQKYFASNASDAELMEYLQCKFALGELNSEEAKLMQEAITAQRDPELRKSKRKQYRSMYGSYNPVVIQAMRIRDARCGVSWTGFNHTDRQVLTNAMGNGAEYFKNVKENSDIATAISMAAFGEDVMVEARKTTPHLVPGNAEEYFNFITATGSSLTFRYGQSKTGELEFELSGSGRSEIVKRSDRAGRILFKDAKPGCEYVVKVKRAGKVIAERKVTVPAASKGQLIARVGIIADPHVSLIPNARYGRMHMISGPMLDLAIKDLFQSNVDFIVMPGDVTDASRPVEIESVAKILKQYPKMTFYAVPGNHDYMNKKDFNKSWVKTFGASARLEKHGNLQILLLDTYNGLLADKEENLKAIDALNSDLPVIVITHYQLKADTFMTDPDRVIHDADKNKNGQEKTPELAKKSASRLEKLAKMQGFILVGHKNVATTQKLGNLVQINLPQLTQFPAGYCYADIYTDGMRLEFRPGLNEFYAEYSRLRCAIYGMDSRVRDTNSLKVWNNFYPMDLSKGKK